MNILEKITDAYQQSIYLKYAATLPFDIVGFAKELGIEVKESEELSEKISGFIKQNEDGKIFICVNKNHHINRKRFTVAHELGHYFLHKDKLISGIIDGVLNREDGIANSIEYQADEFGANLLMPEIIFKQLWQDNDCSINDMASRFLVSESAIITRAKFLGLARDDYGYFV